MARVVKDLNSAFTLAEKLLKYERIEGDRGKPSKGRETKGGSQATKQWHAPWEGADVR